MQTGNAILSLCCTSSWTVTHAVRCQRHFALILVVFLGLREAFGRKRVVAVFVQKHGEAGQGARHPSPTPNPCRSSCGTSPGAVGKELQGPGPQLACIAAGVVFSGSQFLVEHHLPKVDVPWSLQRASTVATELSWALQQHWSVLARTG